jgi:tetratricopeptide (TPR) repeat protein
MKDIKDRAEIYNQKAIRLFEDGRYEEARQMWQMAIKTIEGPEAENSIEEFAVVPSVSVEEDEEEKEDSLGQAEIPEPSEGGTRAPDNRGATPAWPAGRDFPPKVDQPPADGPLGSTDQDKQRKEAVEEIYKDAIDLYRNGDFDRATERFEEVRWLLPGYRASDQYVTQIENELAYEDQIQPSQAEDGIEQSDDHWKDVIEETERRRSEELAQRAENFYQQAVDYFQEQKFKDAQAKFEETEVFYPGYKDTQKYLARIDQQLLEEQEVIRQEESLLEKKLLEKEESEFEKTVRERELERMKGVEEKADALYKKAIQLYTQGQYQDAKIRFEEVEVLFSDYKFTRKYLSRVKQDIAREEKERSEQKQRQEAIAGKKEMKEWRQAVEEIDQSHKRKLNEEAEQIYQQARKYYARGDARKARLYFQEAGRTVPHYKSTDKFLARINQDLVKERRRRLDRRYRWKVFIQKREEERSREIQTTRKEKDVEALRRRVEPLYLEAKGLYQRGDFIAARQKFMEVVQKIPDYKSSVRFLDRLDVDIRRQEQYKEKEAKRVRERKARMRQFLKERREEKTGWTRHRQKESLGKTLAHIKGVRQEKSVQKAQLLYEAGQADYKDRLLEAAREKFLEIERIIPDYKSTRKYLARITSEIEGKEQIWPEEYLARQRAVEGAQRQGEESAPSEDGSPGVLTSAQQAFFQEIKTERLGQPGRVQGTEAKESFLPEKKAVVDPVSSRDEGNLLIRKIEQQEQKEEPLKAADAEHEQKQVGGDLKREKTLTAERKGNTDALMKRAVEKAYKEALRYFHKRKFRSAELKIKEVESYLADTALEEPFRKAQGVKLQKLRERIQSADARQQREKETGSPQDKKDTDAAAAKAVKVRDPSVKEALRDIEGRQTQIRRERERISESFQRKLEQRYTEAVRLYKKDGFQEARALFLEIDGVSPNYKKTRDYLEKINGKIKPIEPGAALEKKGEAPVVPAAQAKPKADIVNEALDHWEKER